MTDLEGNVIRLKLEQRVHSLILGNTGSGKTWLSCRMLEEAVRENKKALVIDFSNSFSDDEIEKNQLNCLEHVKIFNLNRQHFVWQYKAETKDAYIDELTNCLQKVLEIKGCQQEATLYELLSRYMKERRTLSISKFVEFIKKEIKDMDKEILEDKSVEHLQKIYQKIAPLKNLDKFFVTWCSDECISKEGIILQLGQMPSFQRKFMTKFLLEIYWSEVRSGFIKYEILLIDEIQHLRLNGENAFAQILTEGRKVGVQGIFITQFLKCKSPDERRTILQAGQIFLFRMNIDDTKHWSSLVCMENVKMGKKILNDLRCGEAVLLGEYCLNDSNRAATTPIICKI